MFNTVPDPSQLDFVHMNIPYGNFMDFLTHAPGDWDSSVKDEPLSPDASYDFRLHQIASQSTMTSHTAHFNIRERVIARHGVEAAFTSSSMEKATVGIKTNVPETENVLEEKVDKLMSFNPCQFLGMTLQEQQDMAKIIETPRNNNGEFPMNHFMFRPHHSYENGFSEDAMIREEGHIYHRGIEFCLPQMLMNTNPTSGNPGLTFQPPPEPFFFGTPANELKFNTAANEMRKRNLLFGNRFPALSQTMQVQRTTPTQKVRRPRIKHSRKYGHILWKFILELLMNPAHRHVIRWTGKKLSFKIIDKIQLSRLWSQAKVRQNNVKISYESITRALRSYKPKPKDIGKPAIIAHSMDSNFTYYFNDFYRQEISDEAKVPFDDLVAYAKCAASVDLK